PTFLFLTALLVAVAGLGNAFATTATSDMGVSADVSADCAISAGPMNFGSYDPITTNGPGGTHVVATTNPNVASTLAASATLNLHQGLNPDGASSDEAPARQMAHGSDRLAYTLYQDGARETVWGNTSDSGQPYLGTGTGSSLTVFGVVGRGQAVAAGTYNDTVVATITF